MNDRVTYFRFVEPADPRPPANYERYAYEFRNFLIAREQGEYMLWCVRTLEDTLPPMELRGNFTHREKAEEHVDKFWEREELRKKAFESEIDNRSYALDK